MPEIPAYHSAPCYSITHLGYTKALKKSSEEYEKYQNTQRALEKEQSLKELEEDIKKLKKS